MAPFYQNFLRHIEFEEPKAWKIHLTNREFEEKKVPYSKRHFLVLFTPKE